LPFVITIGESPNAMSIDIIDIFSCNEAGEVVAMRAYWGPENMRVLKSA
jgi:steroid delta-isomerase